MIVHVAALAALMTALAGAATAAAETRRVVLVAANNVGAGSDRPLDYAERDAQRVAALFEELGQVDHVERVIGADAERVIRAFAGLQGRIARWRRRGDRVLFLFYYSGHGTERGLRMGGSELSTDALLAGLSLVGADLRIAVVDACESGTFTRTKGVRNARVASVSVIDRLHTAGEAVIASTSRGEAAQESDALKGSFFTSYWLTGLRGAADRDRDGVVSLHEAYAYAYDRTLVSTVVTAAGIQHPTFKTTLTGREDVALTWPDRSRAHLRFRARSPGSFLVMDRSETTVLAEVSVVGDVSARLALSPGTYLIKKRGSRGLSVALVRLEVDSDAELDESEMRRVPYAVLVEKGDVAAQWVTVSAGFGTTLLDTGATVDLQLGYQRAFGRLLLWPSIATSAGQRDRDQVTLSTAAIGLAAVLRSVRPRWETYAGLDASLPVYVQLVDGERRLSAGAGLDALLGASLHITETTAATIQLRAGARALRTRDDAGMESWTAHWRESVTAGLRLRF